MFDFTILVLPGAYAVSVAVTLDMLQAAAALAPGLSLAKPTWRVVSPAGGAVPLSGGMHIDTLRMPVGRGRDHSVWVVPGLGAQSVADLSPLLECTAAVQAVEGLRHHVAAGGSVAASCSAVFLLQAADLLNGRRVTTAWWLAPQLRRCATTCTVDSDCMVVSDGPVIPGGAAFGQSDLMLHLLKIRWGASLSDAVGKVLLIDGRQAQSSYVVPSMMANGHALIQRLTQCIETALPNPPSVAELARDFAMSERTLSRHVRAATGQRPLMLVQMVRLNRARMLIESSRLTIDQIAAQVGYGDATALRRLMRKMAGFNPSGFRVVEKRAGVDGTIDFPF